MRVKLTCAAITLLFVATTPILAQQSTQATEIAGPATCYLSDENETILEPRQEYQPAPGAATPAPTTPNSTEPMIHSPKRSELAKTGFGSEVLIAATLVATAGAATFTARKHRGSKSR